MQTPEKNLMFCNFLSFRDRSTVLALILSALIVSGCGVEAARTGRDSSEKTEAAKNHENKTKEVSPPQSVNGEPKTAIDIKLNSPADTVRVFYKHLRANRFREAIFLTNLRPAIEGLTDSEIRDLKVDFGYLAQNIPAEFVINGEIIVGDEATVTVNLPAEDTGKLKTQEIKLRREKKFWTILTLDEKAEKIVKKQGKNYFFALRIETHHDEAKQMIERIFKAQLLYSARYKGIYGDIQTLVDKGFLPADVKTSTSTGYNYNIELAEDKKTYQATAVPETYGKTGRLSYLLYVDEAQNPHLEKADKRGKLLKR